MSQDVNPTPGAPPILPKRQSPALRIFVAVCGVVVMLAGIAKCVSGVKTLIGAGTDKQYQQLLADSDKAIDKANQDTVEAQPIFQAFLNDVDKLGLAAVRAQEKQTAQKTSELFSNSIESFHLAATKLEEAIQRKKDDRLNPFFEAKIKSYGLFAQSAEFNREIVRLVLDESIPDIQTLMPKITEVATRRDEARNTAVKASADADESAKKLK
jgi:hypothetical protein